MALIAAKESEQVLILQPREVMLRPFSFPDWTDMRLGLYWTPVASSGSNDAPVNEHVGYTGPSDRLCFGLKDGAISVFPGQASSLFLGMMMPVSAPAGGRGVFVQGGSGTIEERNADGTSGINAVFAGTLGTTYVGGTSASFLTSTAWAYGSVTGATAYMGSRLMRIRIVDRGLATQQVLFNDGGAASIAGSAYTTANLRTLLNSTALTGNTRTIEWNDTADPYAIPDHFYIRNPCYNNQLRLSALILINNTP